MVRAFYFSNYRVRDELVARAQYNNTIYTGLSLFHSDYNRSTLSALSVFEHLSYLSSFFIAFNVVTYYIKHLVAKPFYKQV